MNWIKKGIYTVEELVTENTNSSAEELINPPLLPIINLDDSVDFIKNNLNKSITIVGDYDCDGICSSAILYLALKSLGVTPQVVIPRRFSDGYGISDTVIKRIKGDVVITVDNGIAAAEVIKTLKDMGKKVLIIDHHLMREDKLIPDADVIIDPHIFKESQYKEYCAAGLTYRLVKELLPEDHSLTEELKVLAGIATVADVMNLTGDNRRLVKESIANLSKGVCPKGLWALANECKVSGHITEYDYGFKLGPAINSAGRLHDDGPMEVFNLLTSEVFFTEDLAKIVRDAAKISGYNRIRQDLIKEQLPLAEAEVIPGKPIIVYNENFLEGIVGIIAGNLAEKYKVPAIIFTKSKTPGILKGSGRSDGRIHLKDTLDNCSSLLYKYGGHKDAAGLSVKEEDLDAFIGKFSSLCSVSASDPDTVFYHIEITPENAKETLDEILKFAPYGQGNPPVIVRLSNFTCKEFRGSHYYLMGSNNEHIKWTSANDEISVVGFGKAKEYLEMGAPKEMEFVGSLSFNYYKGNYKVQLEAMDFKTHM